MKVLQRRNRFVFPPSSGEERRRGCKNAAEIPLRCSDSSVLLQGYLEAAAVAAVTVGLAIIEGAGLADAKEVIKVTERDRDETLASRQSEVKM